VSELHRFDGRADAYARWRPGYPTAVWSIVAGGFGLGPCDVVDLGCGTGQLAVMLQAVGCRVIGVEPSAPMRALAPAAVRIVDGTAEATTLPDGSADLAVAGQALHWFEPAATRAEVRRILRGEPRVAAIWNTRRRDTEFSAAVQAIQDEHGFDRIGHHGALRLERLDAFFGAGGWRHASAPHQQRLDRAGLRGWAATISYLPPPGDPAHASILARLDALFDRHASDGTVLFEYDADVYWGTL
jgi:SAM-dependent methyltransferase